jgi:hypothetical protein
MIDLQAAVVGTVSGPAWIALPMQLLVLLAGIVFHRLRDREIFSDDGRRVFTPTTAWLYLAGAVTFLLASIGALTLLAVTGRDSYQTSNPWAVLPGLAAVALYLDTVQRLTWRATKMSPRRSGPIAQLGRFVRLAYGVAVPAAWRRLRTER